MSKLIFEKSVAGRRCVQFPDRKVDGYELPLEYLRETLPALPEIAEVDLVRHYIGLSKDAFGVDNGFYPLGSCTMKYNPKINEDVAALSNFADIHPLQPAETVKGCLLAMRRLTDALCEITGMDAMTLQPAAGAHGEFTGMLMIKAYHEHNNDTKRTKVIIPDSAHGTNPASASMVGYSIISVASNSRGGIDLDALKALVDDETAALMLTNPNTLGLYDENIEEITSIVHQAGGLVYYDGANLNAIMGIARPGDMGFDVIHLNLHKTFSTPHGGGGPGSGPVGCKRHLEPFLPSPLPKKDATGFAEPNPLSIGQVRSFYGNFAVCLKALTYLCVMGRNGLKQASQCAVLNANYLMEKIKGLFLTPYERVCMHEFVVSLEAHKQAHDINAKDVAKALIDFGIHPPTMYFPLIVKEALMFEPTETESRETLDHAIEALREIDRMIREEPESMRHRPKSTPVCEIDEVKAARHPILRYK